MSHILLMEGKLTRAEALRFKLEAAGSRVETARDEAHACELAERHRFNLLILPYQTARIAAKSFFARIRRVERHETTPAILIRDASTAVVAGVPLEENEVIWNRTDNDWDLVNLAHDILTRQAADESSRADASVSTTLA